MTMESLIKSHEDIERLRTLAEAWKGTPYAPDGAVRGKDGGISCHRVPYQILVEFGMALEEVQGRAGVTKSGMADAMVSWLDGHSDAFKRIQSPEPGAVICMDVPIGHLVLALDRGEVVHVWHPHGVIIEAFEQVRRSRERVRGIWRPLRRPCAHLLKPEATPERTPLH